MTTNLEIYEKVRAVPKEAQKTIGSGKLKGYTDINPMWRIKTLTEQFGICGVGWYYKITEKRLEKGHDDNNVAAFVDIELYVKQNGEWSQPIVGTGGSAFVQYFKTAGYAETSDECFKMALTDAISVACKALGIGADVYWAADRTKYDAPPAGDGNGKAAPKAPEAKVPPQPSTAEQIVEINQLYSAADIEKVKTYYKVKDIKELDFATAAIVITRRKKAKAGDGNGK
jgi:hypothetical protein